MTEKREELKGKLLLLWIEDLRNDRDPKPCPEMQILTELELEEVMRLARFIKAVVYPSEALPRDVGEYAKGLAVRAFEELGKRTGPSEANSRRCKKSRAHGHIEMKGLEREKVGY